MRVICVNKKCKNSRKGELVPSGLYFRYPRRFKCSECGDKVKPDKASREQIKSRWQMINLSEGRQTRSKEI